MNKYINYEMCKKCGGICCKENGCIYLPEDFKKMEINYIISLLNEGNISISGQFYQIGDKAFSYLPFLRARNKNADIVDLITLGGPCKLLTVSGCKLDASKRPALGLLITPTKIGGPCKKEYELEDAFKWLDYSEIIEILVKHYTNNQMSEQLKKELKLRLKSIKQKILHNIALTEMEKIILSSYENIIKNKVYYSPQKVKKMHLF